MAEWSLLPIELLGLIAKRLGTEIDVIRFRSVCSSWRAAVAADAFPTPCRFPILPKEGISDTSLGFYLFKRTILRLGLPESDTQRLRDGWLIKIERDVPQKTRLFNPLSRFHFRPLPASFPRSLDSLKFRVSELGHEYTLQYINYRPVANSIGDAGSLYMKKVALSSGACSGSGTESFVLLTIHVSGKLAMFKFGGRKWTIIDDLPSQYDDVILFDGRFYAVDITGRTVIVNVDSSPVVSLVADCVCGGNKKFLVESCGELLLVDTYMSFWPEVDLGFDEGLEFYEDFDCYVSERTFRFKVFRLVRDEQRWVGMESLGDRMLFLGDNCAFSASALDFSGCKGNCIFFAYPEFYSSRDEDGALKGWGVGVFDLETGSIGSLANYPDYSKLFWPPLGWVSSAMVEGAQMACQT